MRFLILSGSTGGGHNSAAMAIKEYCEAQGNECEIKDALTFCSEGKAYLVNNGHVFIYKKAPKLFGLFYHLLEKKPKEEGNNSILYDIITFGGKGLYKYLKANHYDAIICTHIFAGMLVTHIKAKYNLDIKIHLVATDYTCSPGAYEVDADYIFIPHRYLLDEFKSYGIKEEKLISSGIPVRSSFYERTDKLTAKKDLGLPTDKKIVLLMGGSMGCGPIAKLSETICKKMAEDSHLVVISGNNKKLYKELKKINAKNLTVISFTDRVPLYMDASEVILSKAGGLSSTETLTKGLPLILIDAVPGCESRNLAFLTRHGFAKSGNGIENLADVVCDYLNDPKKIAETKALLEKEFSLVSAKIIIDVVMENVNK